MTTRDLPAELPAVPAQDRYGRPCLGVPLSGTRGAGKLALLDAAGVNKLRSQGVRALTLTGDGEGREYVVFHRAPGWRITSAARVIADAAVGYRVEHIGGDRLDLRSQSLRVRRHAKAGAGRSPRTAVRAR